MNEKLWLISGGLLPLLAVRADGFDQALAKARATAPGYYTGVLAGTGRELFRHVLDANEDYVDSINQECNAETQEAALAVCRALMDEVLAQGLCSEYRVFVETLGAVKAHQGAAGRD